MLLCSVQIFINYLGRTKGNDGLKYFQLMSAPLVLYSWTATILGHDEENTSTEAATEISIC